MRARHWIVAGCVVSALLGCSRGGDKTVAPKPPECPPAEPLTLDIPAGFPELVSPGDNPLTVEGVALGRRLFYDPILSGDSTQACATCHVQVNAFGDPRRFSEGIHHVKGTRNAPTIVNPAWIPMTFWDGRADGLEGQARQPVPNPIEMDSPWPDVVQRLERSGTYPELFCAAFGDKKITENRVVKAIAQFERTFISKNSKYDRAVLYQTESFTAAEQRGYDLFRSERGGCFHCHPEPLFARSTIFSNTGLDSIPIDHGRGDVTGDPADFGKFKPGTLRNITESYPYMHDGRFSTLGEVIDHYNLGFYDVANVDSLILARLSRPPLTAQEISDLLAFLATLTDPDFLYNPAFSNPFKTSASAAKNTTSSKVASAPKNAR